MGRFYLSICLIKKQKILRTIKYFVQRVCKEKNNKVYRDKNKEEIKRTKLIIRKRGQRGNNKKITKVYYEENKEEMKKSKSLL